MNKDKALAGLKVVDLTSALSGPFCTMFFADFGADVIKIEPVGGEQCRTWGPLDEETGESGFFASANRNKKGCTLNLKSEKGLNMLYELVKDADFFCENYKGGVTKRLGIDYETIKKINPRIIYVSGSGFGQNSPLSHRPCYDIVAQAMGGIISLTGNKGQDPVKVGPSIADHVSGIYQMVGALIALHYREKTGKGQLVDVSMVDTIFSILENAIPTYTMTGEVPSRQGNIDPSIAPFDIYECRDGFIAVGVGNNRLWEKFCKIMEREDLINDPRYKTNELRSKNYLPDLQKTIQDWIFDYSKFDLEVIMEEESIPCGPVLDIQEAIEHPHIKANEMVVTVNHPTYGEMQIQGIVPKLSETPGNVETAPPLVGQHNKEVFGLTDEEEANLRAEGVI